MFVEPLQAATMWKFIQRLLAFFGLILLTALALCFTHYPWRAYRWLGTDAAVMPEEPDVIVMLGGGGIPSESGLMRSYMVSEAARQYSNALVAVAMPDTNDISSVRLKDELILRGIKAERIVWEDRGRNTREQALRLRDMLYADGADPIVLLVTSPAHLKRSMLTFRKAGFTQIFAVTEFGVSIKTDLEYDDQDLGSNPIVPMPDIGSNVILRYHFWNNLGLEARLVHEWAALVYYRLMGWI